MKKGMLITNGFVGEESFKSLFRALMEAAEKENIAIEQQSNDSLLFDIASGEPLFDIDRYSFGIFWDKDIMLGQMLEKCGLRLFNSARAVALCDDKALTHAALSGRLPMPKTVPVPQTYKYVGYGEMAFLKRAAEYLGLPLIIKECRGSFGKQVYLADTEEQAAEIIRSHEATPMIMQQAVRESFGRDVRIYVVGGEVMGAMRRSNDHSQWRQCGGVCAQRRGKTPCAGGGKTAGAGLRRCGHIAFTRGPAALRGKLQRTLCGHGKEHRSGYFRGHNAVHKE